MPVWLVPLIPQILQGIQMAINAAPEAIKIVGDIKALFSSWFSKNLISVEQQKAVHDFLDALVAMTQAGVIPPAWQVQPDPAGYVPPALPPTTPPPPAAGPTTPIGGGIGSAIPRDPVPGTTPPRPDKPKS